MSRGEALPRRTPARVYRDVVLTGFHALLLFTAINLLILLVGPAPPPTRLDLARDFRTPRELYETDRQTLRDAYDGRSDEEILRLIDPPGLSAHPTLELMGTPTRSPDYGVGFENMRYTAFVTAENAERVIDGATWVFGGSTTFGLGVRDDETIPAWLDALDPTGVYLNFGCPAAHQNHEIEKLLLLLRKGYCPDRVIFIDGLNDITAMRASNFAPVETPTRLRDAYGYVANIERVRSPSWRTILGRLPVLRALEAWRHGDERVGPGSVPGPDTEPAFDDLDTPGALYHEDPIRHYERTSSAAVDYAGAVRRLPFYREKILAYYRLNGRFLERVGAAFGFDVYVFLQPMGNLHPGNPFVRDPAAYRASAHYRYFESMTGALREAIQAGRLPHMVDISDADLHVADGYVDGAHYGPRLSRRIAERILAALPPGRV